MDNGWGGSRDEQRAAGLLIFLLAKGGSLVNIGEYYQGDITQLQDAFRHIDMLASEQLIDKSAIGGGMASLDISLTGKGRKLASSYKGARDSRLKRAEGCRAAILAWLYEAEAIDRHSRAQFPAFYNTTFGYFYGRLFDDSDFRSATKWLEGQGMVNGVDSQMGLVHVWLTDKGVRVIERSGGDPGAHIDATSEPQPQQHLNINVSGNLSGTMNIAGRDVNVSQSVEGIALAIRGIGEIIRSLGLADGREDELAELEQRAVATVESDTADEAALQGFFGWVRDCVREGGSAPVIAAVTVLTSDLLQAAGHTLGLG